MRGISALFGAAAIYLVVRWHRLLVSTLVDTQQQAMFVTFFIMSAYSSERSLHAIEAWPW